MKVVTVLGSPRKRGNTHRVLSWVEEQLRAAGHEVERYDIVDYVVRGCTGCNTCQRQESALPSCAQDDDATLILGAMQRADAFVLASPVYCWGLTAQLKALVDRSYAAAQWSQVPAGHLLAGRTGALVATAAGGSDDLALLVPPFEALLRMHQCESGGHLLVPGCGEPEELGAEVRVRAQAFATALVGVAASAAQRPA